MDEASISPPPSHLPYGNNYYKDYSDEDYKMVSLHPLKQLSVCWEAGMEATQLSSQKTRQIQAPLGQDQT